MTETLDTRSMSIARSLPVLLLLAANLQGQAATTRNKPTPTVAHKTVAIDADTKARDILTSLTDHEPRQTIRPMDRAALEELRRRSQVRQEKVTAAEAQLELLGPGIIPLLAKNLNNTDPEICTVCSEVLKFFGPSIIPAVLSNYTQASKAQYFRMALNSMTAEALPAMLPMLKSESEAKRLLGIGLLGQLLTQNQSNFYPIEDSLEIGIPRSIHSRPRVNRYPLPETFQKSLCEIAAAEKVATVRASLCHLLGMLGTGIPVVSETLITLASTDPEPTVRLEAIIALGNVRVVTNDSAIDGALRKYCSDDSAEQCRAAAIDALMLADNSSPENLQVLRNALSDRSKLVVFTAMNGIYRLGLKGRPLAADLVKIINGNPDSSMTSGAIVALSMLQSPSANELDMFMKLLDNPDTKIRNAALVALGKMHETAIPAVPKIAALIRESELASSRQAITALGEIGPGAASTEDTLKAIALSRGINSMYARQALKKIDPSYEPAPRPPSVVPVPSTSPSTKI